jgi:hypothetical protein
MAVLVAALTLSTPIAAKAYTYEGPSQASIERREREAKASAEQAAKEKQEREARETQEREAREHPPVAQPPQEPEAGPSASNAPSAVRCVVPSLKGHSLPAATRLLVNAHCKLGKVTRSRGGHSKTLVVTTQSAAHGRQLPEGAAIAIQLGPSSAKHH